MSQQNIQAYDSNIKEAHPKMRFYPAVPDYLHTNDNAPPLPDEGFIEGTALVEPVKNGDIPVWDISPYVEAMKGKECPPTVHPSLWQQEQMNNISGLFRVPCKGFSGKNNETTSIYQLRGYSISTMSFVQSENGWIVIDPLDGRENMKAGLKIFRKKVSKEPIVAIIVTHSHADHYMGIDAILFEDEKSPLEITGLEEPGLAEIYYSEGKVAIVAPDGFYNEAVSENFYLGNSMARRAGYMYGSVLIAADRIDEKGHLGTGLGKTVSIPTGTLHAPSLELKMKDGKKDRALLIDGLEVVFQDAPGTEAPAEFHVFFPAYGAFCPGENVTHTMHNLLTPRGAKVRNPKAFAEAIDYALEEYGEKTEVIIGTHHWSVQGGEACREMLVKQRDMYRFFNDQVIRKANMGMNPEEIAESFRLPESLDKYFYNRGYYGTVNHNVKAVFQYYVGWWDGNPANYFKLPDVEQARLYVDLIGENKLMEKAGEYFKKGEFRFVLEILKHVVFTNPYNEQACHLQADAVEQLGYSFEAGTWRNIFLTGALELRNGYQTNKGENDRKKEFIAKKAEEMKKLSPAYIFELLSTMVKAECIKNTDTDFFKIIISFTTDEMPDFYAIDLENSVLHYKRILPEENTPDVECTIEEFAEKYKQISTDLLDGRIPDGNKVLIEFFSFLDVFDTKWNIVFPLYTNTK